VTLKTHDIRGLQQIRIVVGPVDVVTAIATDAVRVHDALDEIISLHAVLVRRAIGKVGERLFPEFVLLQLPVIL
jgi:hypothetical protein